MNLKDKKQKSKELFTEIWEEIENSERIDLGKINESIGQLFKLMQIIYNEKELENFFNRREDLKNKN